LTPLPVEQVHEVEILAYIPPLPTGADLIELVAVPPQCSFAAIVLMTSMWGRCVSHLYLETRHPSEEKDFWARHLILDTTATKVFNMCIGSSIYQGPPSKHPHGLFVLILYHTIVIYLHQAVIDRVDSSAMPRNVAAESSMRCQVAAKEIATQICEIPNSEIIFGVSESSLVPYLAKHILNMFLDQLLCRQVTSCGGTGFCPGHKKSKGRRSSV
jgi:hypothetical protein